MILSKSNKIIRLFAFALLSAWFLGHGTAQTALNSAPARLLGQLPPGDRAIPEAKGLSPNLLEGRELFAPEAVALDTSANPPIVYVCDRANHRVLGWRDSRSFHNGAFADVVLGQRDLQSSLQYAVLDPGFFSGLNNPTGIAVDSQGNVFVFDAGNNRILRFSAPFQRPAGQAQTADMIIGQTTRTGRNPNLSTNNAQPPTASTLRTSASNIGTQFASLAFDPAGNLWASDSGNHRLLRYSRNDVTAPTNINVSGDVTPVISAQLVLGQDDFVTNSTVAGREQDRTNKKKIRFGGPLTFDSAGNLYYSDDLGRVLYFTAPFDNGEAAVRILGIVQALPGQPPPTPINDTGFGAVVSSGVFVAGPRGLFTINDRLFVVDTYFNRILQFDPPSLWPPEAARLSPRASVVYGQWTFTSGHPNRWDTWLPSARTFDSPAGAVFASNEVWIADTSNNRVLVFPNLSETGASATARGILGQWTPELRAANLINGREFSAAAMSVQGLTSPLRVGPAIAIDRALSRSHFYVADSGNNRVLGFRDARTFQAGQYAEIVIGQLDFVRDLVNSPYNDPLWPTREGLSIPSGVAVDADGNLWVADTGNGRVLMYLRPFDNPTAAHRKADLVIGQPWFDVRPAPEPKQANLLRPVALAFTAAGQLLVADVGHNRVLRFDPPFSSGMPASLVLGQSDFFTATAGTAPNQFGLPTALSVDNDDRLYVADTTNNRVLIFSRISTASTNGPSAAYSLTTTTGGPTQPLGVAVSRITGEIYVSDARSSAVKRFPDYLSLIAAPSVTSQNLGAFGPFALALDHRDNLYYTDAASRVAVHYPQLASINAGSGFQRLAPGMIANLEAKGVQFTSTPGSASGSPLPKQLAGVELRVNGVPAALMSVNGSKITYVVPWSAPTSGYSEFIARNVDTGEILAHQWQLIDPLSPAFLIRDGIGAGQIRAKNQDGSDNTAANAAVRGSEVTLYLTGYGALPGAPDDGIAAEVPAPLDGQVIVGAGLATVLSSAFDPVEPGVWRVKIRLPSASTGVTPVALVHKDNATNTNPANGQKIVTTIAIRP